MRDARHDSSITAFQQKRGGDAAAFFVPFLAPGMRLLDVGCGPGTITAALAEIVGTATGVDIDPNAIAAAKQLTAQSDATHLSFVEADMAALPFQDDAFDAVFFHRCSIIRTGRS